MLLDTHTHTDTYTYTHTRIGDVTNRNASDTDASDREDAAAQNQRPDDQPGADDDHQRGEHGRRC